jgi:hypothetical protein
MQMTLELSEAFAAIANGAIRGIGDTIPIPQSPNVPTPSPTQVLPYPFTLGIPEAFAAQLIAAGKDPAREALEALAVEGYRTRQLNESQVRRMLGYGTRMKVHALLAARGVPLNYTMENLEQDIQAANSLHADWLSQTAETR